eukprot:TRINITY_DN2825_c0_g1_i1.p1 TRINITY_DN2825_c0_g1~~TRINITY_DN2825_c0_g1_i1.p1  ORF type:complete len:134 (-),score=29.58 TRINITY_DN2825_c0_g1_i1:21-422(-)
MTRTKQNSHRVGSKRSSLTLPLSSSSLEGDSEGTIKVLDSSTSGYVFSIENSPSNSELESRRKEEEQAKKEEERRKEEEERRKAEEESRKEEERRKQKEDQEKQAKEEERRRKEIGRAVQQECRDRSRMPSSA